MLAVWWTRLMSVTLAPFFFFNFVDNYISLDVITTENVAIVYCLCKYGKRAIQYPIKILIFISLTISLRLSINPLFSPCYIVIIRFWGNGGSRIDCINCIKHLFNAHYYWQYDMLALNLGASYKVPYWRLS